MNQHSLNPYASQRQPRQDNHYPGRRQHNVSGGENYRQPNSFRQAGSTLHQSNPLPSTSMNELDCTQDSNEEETPLEHAPPFLYRPSTAQSRHNDPFSNASSAHGNINSSTRGSTVAVTGQKYYNPYQSYVSRQQTDNDRLVGTLSQEERIRNSGFMTSRPVSTTSDISSSSRNMGMTMSQRNGSNYQPSLSSALPANGTTAIIHNPYQKPHQFSRIQQSRQETTAATSLAPAPAPRTQQPLQGQPNPSFQSTVGKNNVGFSTGVSNEINIGEASSSWPSSTTTSSLNVRHERPNNLHAGTGSVTRTVEQSKPPQVSMSLSQAPGRGLLGSAADTQITQERSVSAPSSNIHKPYIPKTNPYTGRLLTQTTTQNNTNSLAAGNATSGNDKDEGTSSTYVGSNRQGQSARETQGLSNGDAQNVHTIGRGPQALALNSARSQTDQNGNQEDQNQIKRSHVSESEMTALQQQIKELQAKLAEKEEETFELKASITCVQAESNYQVEMTQKEASDKCDAMQRELRQAEMERRIATSRLAEVLSSNKKKKKYQETHGEGSKNSTAQTKTATPANINNEAPGTLSQAARPSPSPLTPHPHRPKQRLSSPWKRRRQPAFDEGFQDSILGDQDSCKDDANDLENDCNDPSNGKGVRRSTRQLRKKKKQQEIDSPKRELSPRRKSADNKRRLEDIPENENEDTSSPQKLRTAQRGALGASSHESDGALANQLLRDIHFIKNINATKLDGLQQTLGLRSKESDRLPKAMSVTQTMVSSYEQDWENLHSLLYALLANRRRSVTETSRGHTLKAKREWHHIVEVILTSIISHRQGKSYEAEPTITQKQRNENNVLAERNNDSNPLSKEMIGFVADKAASDIVRNDHLYKLLLFLQQLLIVSTESRLYMKEMLMISYQKLSLAGESGFKQPPLTKGGARDNLTVMKDTGKKRRILRTSSNWKSLENCKGTTLQATTTTEATELESVTHQTLFRDFLIWLRDEGLNSTSPVSTTQFTSDTSSNSDDHNDRRPHENYQLVRENLASNIRLTILRIFAILTRHQKACDATTLHLKLSTTTTTALDDCFHLICHFSLSAPFVGTQASTTTSSPSRRQTRRSSATSISFFESSSVPRFKMNFFSQLVRQGRSLLNEAMYVDRSIAELSAKSDGMILLIERMLMYEMEAKTVLLELLSHSLSSAAGCPIVLKYLHEEYQRQQQRQKRLNNTNKSKRSNLRSKQTNDDLLSSTLSEMCSIIKCVKASKTDSERSRFDKDEETKSPLLVNDLTSRMLKYAVHITQFWNSVTQRDPALMMLTFYSRHPLSDFGIASERMAETLLSGFNIVVDALVYLTHILYETDEAPFQYESVQAAALQQSVRSATMMVRHIFSFFQMLASHLENWDFEAEGAPPYPFTLIDAIGGTKVEALKASCIRIVTHESNDIEPHATTHSAIGIRLDTSTLNIATRLMEEYLDYSTV